jgi:hypothetical protein
VDPHEHFARQKPVRFFARAEKTQKIKFLKKNNFRSGRKLKQLRSNFLRPIHHLGPKGGVGALGSQSLVHLRRKPDSHEQLCQLQLKHCGCCPNRIVADEPPNIAHTHGTPAQSLSSNSSSSTIPAPTISSITPSSTGRSSRPAIPSASTKW